MAVATVDPGYVCASGEVLSAGRFRRPAWRRELSPLTCSLVGSNTISQLDPKNDPLLNPNYPGEAPWRATGGQSGVIYAWSGGIYMPKHRGLYIYGGGHDDYGGNEIYFWDEETALFKRLTNPTGCIGNEGDLINIGINTGDYFDGRQRSCHTYGNFAARTDDEWWCFGGSPYKGGSSANAAYKWDGSDLIRGSVSTVQTHYGAVCYDPTRDVFWSLEWPGNIQAYYFNPTAQTSTKKGNWIAAHGSYVNIKYSLNHDSLVVFADAIHVFPCNGSIDSIQITTIGTAPTFGIGNAGVEYDEENDRYLLWNGGSSIFTLTPPPAGQNPRTESWVWGQIDFTGTPSDPAIKGTWGRFWHSKRLNCCGVVNATSQKMYIFTLD